MTAWSPADFFDLGEGGIGIAGGDRRRLTPAGNYASNNHIHHFGLLKKHLRPRDSSWRI